MSTAEVAEHLDRPVGTINRWAAEGKIPVAYKVGGRTGANVFNRADVENFAKTLPPVTGAEAVS